MSFKCPDVSTLKENTQASIYTETISNKKYYFQHRGIFQGHSLEITSWEKKMKQGTP